MAKYEPKESYIHRFAKNLLARELRDKEKNGDYCGTSAFSWRRNYGVFTELPFYETSDAYYFELSGGLRPDFGVGVGDDPLLWFDPVFDRGKILFVPDITVFHKGQAAILIEIIHSNPVSSEKLKKIQQFFAGNYVELYEASAYNVLARIPGTDIKFKRVL